MTRGCTWCQFQYPAWRPRCGGAFWHALHRTELTDCNSNDGLYVPHRHVHSSWYLALLSQLHVELVDQAQMPFVELRMASLSGILDVVSQESALDLFVVLGRLWNEIFVERGVLLFVGMVLHVQVDHKGAEIVVYLRIHLVAHHVQNVETGENGIGKVYIFAERKLRVVSPLQWVRSSNNRTPGSKSGHYSCLRDRDGLLLHRFVDRGAIVFVHFVELVDKADSPVSQNQGSCLQFPLICRMVAFHAGSQTNCRCSFSRCVNGAVKSFLYAFEELGLGDSRVSEKEHVDVSSNPVRSLNNSFHSAEHRHRQSPLDVVMPIDGGSNRLVYYFV